MSVSDSTALRYQLQDPDVRLMLQVRDDNAAAFEELVLRYQQRLVSLFGHMVYRADLAEDLAQEVFLRIYRARKTYQPGAKFSTWCFRIAHNVASNALRSNNRRREYHLSRTSTSDSRVGGMDELAVARSGAQPTRLFDTIEKREMVHKAIAALNERQRMALLLSKFEGQSYAEIAETMELSVQAIKSLLSRARANLKSLLEPYMDQGDLPVDGQPSS